MPNGKNYPMTIPARKLETLAIGSPITRRGVSFFPIYLTDNELPAIATGEESGLVVEELDDASVNTLRVKNPGDKPVLVVEGEHFLGGKQNRAVNATVLVPALASLDLPVSCLEEGRWGEAQAWKRDTAFAPTSVRREKNVGVHLTMAEQGHRQGNQGAVWSAVGTMLDSADVDSDTGAAADIKTVRKDRSLAETMEKLAAMGPLPGQCGVIVTHGRWVQSMDLFGAPHLLAEHWGALIRSHLLEPPGADGRPSATRVLEIVRRFALGFFGGGGHEEAGVGLGVEHRMTDDRLSGHALSLKGAIAHAAFFARWRDHRPHADVNPREEPGIVY